MRILCVIDSLGSGGAQKQLVELSKGFKVLGHDVSFLVYHEINFYKWDLDKAGIGVVQILDSNYIKRLIKIRKYIRSNNFNAILSFLQASNFICEIATLPYKNWKLVVGERSANPNILKSFKLRIFRWFHVFADHIVSNSYKNIEIIKKINFFISSNKYHVIYNLVDFEVWKKINHHIPPTNGKFNLIVIASHRSLKNAKGLIYALLQLTDIERDMILIDWYGGQRPDDSFSEAKSLIKEFNLDSIIRFHDPINIIAPKVSLADGLGLFSFYEGLPNTVCEGMAMGKVVISSKVSDIPRLLSHCPQLLFDPTNIEDIAVVLKRIIRLSQNEILEIGNENKTRAIKFFNKDKIINDYLKLMSI